MHFSRFTVNHLGRDARMHHRMMHALKTPSLNLVVFADIIITQNRYYFNNKLHLAYRESRDKCRQRNFQRF